MTKEHILFLLKYKQFVALEDKETKGYVVVTSWQDKVFSSGKMKTIEDAMGSEEFDITDFEGDWLQFYTLHSTFDFPKQRYEVGQKVRVREDAEKWCKYLNTPWGEIKQEMVGKTFEITPSGDSEYRLGRGNFFPHEALDPVYEEKCK